MHPRPGAHRLARRLRAQGTSTHTQGAALPPSCLVQHGQAVLRFGGLDVKVGHAGARQRRLQGRQIVEVRGKERGAANLRRGATEAHRGGRCACSLRAVSPAGDPG